MEEQLKPMIARCQTCQTLTDRKCSVCNVCIYCSSDCEAKAATLCFGDVACKMHRSLSQEDTNIGHAAAHFLMLPSTQTDLTARASSQLRWNALHNAAVHYLHILLACSPSRVNQKTAFGLTAVLTPEFRYSCGCQRINFPFGKTSQAAAKIVGNMGKLALAQMGEARPVPLSLRNSDGAQDERQAVIVSGFVAKVKGDASYEPLQHVVHFDSIYVTHSNNAWTVRRVQPLWEQKLKTLDHKLYEMPFKPEGRVPPKERHPLPLLESALNPPTETAATPSLGTTTSNPSPTSASSTPQAVQLPPSVAELPEETAPLSVATAMAPALAMAGQSSRSKPRAPRPSKLSPTAQWADYRAAAQAQAEAQEEAPPWAAQLQAALQNA